MKIHTICVSKMARSEAIGGTRGVAIFCFLFFYPAAYVFFFISSSLPIFIFTGIHTHVLIWALASGVGSFLVSLPFLNLWEVFFFCPFLFTHDKLLLSTPKVSLFHWGDGWVALCSFPSHLFPSRLTWLIRTGVGRGYRGAELLFSLFFSTLLHWLQMGGGVVLDEWMYMFSFFHFCR